METLYRISGLSLWANTISMNWLIPKLKRRNAWNLISESSLYTNRQTGIRQPNTVGSMVCIWLAFHHKKRMTIWKSISKTSVRRNERKKPLWSSKTSIQFFVQASVTITFGRPEPIWLTREISSGWQTDDRLHSPTGMPANRTISGTKMAKRKIAWNCGIATVKDWSGTIRRAALKHILCAKFNNCVENSKNLFLSPPSCKVPETFHNLLYNLHLDPD